MKTHCTQPVNKWSWKSSLDLTLSDIQSDTLEKAVVTIHRWCSLFMNWELDAIEMNLSTHGNLELKMTYNEKEWNLYGPIKHVVQIFISRDGLCTWYDYDIKTGVSKEYNLHPTEEELWGLSGRW